MRSTVVQSAPQKVTPLLKSGRRQRGSEARSDGSDLLVLAFLLLPVWVVAFCF